jgi:hypothetical protein
MSEVNFNYNSRIQTDLTEHKLARTYQIAKRLQKPLFGVVCFEATQRKISNMLHSTVLLHQRKFACSLNSATKNFQRTKCNFFFVTYCKNLEVAKEEIHNILLYVDKSNIWKR